MYRKKRLFLQGEISCDGKKKRKAEAVDLAVNAHEMELAKVCDGKSEDMNT